MASLRFLGFAKENASVPVYELTVDKSLEEGLKNEVPKVPKNLYSGHHETSRTRSQKRGETKNQIGIRGLVLQKGRQRFCILCSLYLKLPLKTHLRSD